MSSDKLEIIKTKYESAKKLAEEFWLDGDHEGNNNDFYYFQCGFVAGMNYENTKQNEGFLKDEKEN